MFRRHLLACTLLMPAPAVAQTLPPLTLVDVDADVTVLETRVAAVEATVASNTAAVVEIGARINASVAATGAVDAKVNQLAAKSAEVDLIARNAAETAATLRADVDASAIRTDLLDARVQANSAAVAAIDARAMERDGAVAGLTDRVGAIASRTDDVNAALTATAAAVAGLGDEVAGTTATVARHAAQLVQLDERTRGTDLALADVDARVLSNSTRITNVDARVNVVEQRVTFNEARVDAQDVVLVDHDRRITRAQATADTARDENVTLRADVDVGRAGLVRQAGPNAEVTVAAGSGGDAVRFTGTAGDRRLSGVAAGVAANDAATVGQVQVSAGETLAAANAYTDRSVSQMMTRQTATFERMIDANNAVVKRSIDSSAAGSAALASLPQSIVPGEGMAGMSLGGKGDQVAVAMGVSKAFAGRHTPILRAGAAVDTRTGDATYNAGVGIHF